MNKVASYTHQKGHLSTFPYLILNPEFYSSNASRRLLAQFPLTFVLFFISRVPCCLQGASCHKDMFHLLPANCNGLLELQSAKASSHSASSEVISCNMSMFMERKQSTGLMRYIQNIWQKQCAGTTPISEHQALFRYFPP